MRNLAGVEGADAIIAEELRLAGIRSIVLSQEKGKHPEVLTTTFGSLGGKAIFDELAARGEELKANYWDMISFSVFKQCAEFVFYRNWYYYVATGHVPMDVAIELYEHPVGRKDVRVEGHCGCPDPRDYPPVQKSVLVAGKRCVSCYHIDSQEGLNLFVEVLRKHKLFEE